MRRLSWSWRYAGVGAPAMVGHSFGGSVALKVAGLLDSRVGSLILLEPNPFTCSGRTVVPRRSSSHAACETRAKCYGALGDWAKVAERFADYWLGDGSWSIMSEKRRTALLPSHSRQTSTSGMQSWRRKAPSRSGRPQTAHAGGERRRHPPSHSGDRGSSPRRARIGPFTPYSRAGIWPRWADPS